MCVLAVCRMVVAADFVAYFYVANDYYCYLLAEAS